MFLRKLTLISLILLFLPFFSDSPAQAAIKTLNGLNPMDQTFVNDSNIEINSPSGGSTHNILWNGFLPVSRGGTGVGSFTNGSIPFIGSGLFAQDNSNFFWDNTNKRLGIGTASPSSALDVSGNAKVDSLTTTSDSTIHSLNIGLGGGSILTNLVIGMNTLTDNIIGARNVAIGGNALSGSNTNDNTAVGFGTLADSNNSGEENTAAGSQALAGNISGNYSSAFGFQALWLNSSGARNVAVGHSSLQHNDTGSRNVALGSASMSQNTTGESNVAIGETSFTRNSTGTSNVVIGHDAARVQTDGITYLTTANNSIYIGNAVQGYDNNDNNSIVLGTGAIGAGANKTVIGNSSMTDVYFGSVTGLANTHSKKMFLGSSSTPGCIVMGDTAGGIGYITLNSGVLTVSTSPPSACQ